MFSLAKVELKHKPRTIHYLRNFLDVIPSRMEPNCLKQSAILYFKKAAMYKFSFFSWSGYLGQLMIVVQGGYYEELAEEITYEHLAKLLFEQVENSKYQQILDKALYLLDK